MAIKEREGTVSGVKNGGGLLPAGIGLPRHGPGCEPVLRERVPSEHVLVDIIYRLGHARRVVPVPGRSFIGDEIGPGSNGFHDDGGLVFVVIFWKLCGRLPWLLLGNRSQRRVFHHDRRNRPHRGIGHTACTQAAEAGYQP